MQVAHTTALLGNRSPWQCQHLINFAVFCCFYLEPKCVHVEIQYMVINHLILFLPLSQIRGFPHSSVGKESICSAGDPSSIPGLGRYTGGGIGCPLQYSWASLVAQPVKNLPAMREAWVRSLGWEDPLEKGKATHFHILAWRISWTV